MGRLGVASICAAFWLCAAGARAQEEAHERSEPGVLFLFNEVGPGGPFGWLGLGIAGRPVPWWSLQFGAGVNWRGWPQIGAGTGFHYAFSEDEDAGVLLAASRDTYQQNSGLYASPDYEKRWISYWTYLAVQGRTRLVGPLFARGTIGLTLPVATPSFTCSHAPGDADARRVCNKREFGGELSVMGSVGLEIELL